MEVENKEYKAIQLIIKLVFAKKLKKIEKSNKE
jgi:hypothetical protein